jgi:DNA-binding MarR family transcriptional regulator
MTDAGGRDDWADRHVARWKDHWLDVPFDDETEAIFIRMARIMRHLRERSQNAITQSGLQDFEFATLHQLMVRDTPGHASPTELADDLGISGAGMTGRLDALEKTGWIKRTPQTDDRRRVDVEATREGIEMWRKAMHLRGQEDEATILALSPQEKTVLAGLLKKMALAIEE